VPCAKRKKIQRWALKDKGEETLDPNMAASQLSTLARVAANSSTVELIIEIRAH
jgi:hypothetical protein